jgi:hypothetical protein
MLSLRLSALRALADKDVRAPSYLIVRKAVLLAV